MELTRPREPNDSCFETSHGGITIELSSRTKRRLSVANFLQYVDDGFYDGAIFHRIVPGFVIQGGGLTPSSPEEDAHARSRTRRPTV